MLMVPCSHIIYQGNKMERGLDTNTPQNTLLPCLNGWMCVSLPHSHFTHTHTLIYAHTHLHAHSLSHLFTHTHTHTFIYIHTHTHLFTQTQRKREINDHYEFILYK